MKKVFFFFCLLLPFLSIAQKIEYDKKTNQISVDGVPSFKIVREDCGFGMPDCHFDVLDNENNKLFRINIKSFNSPVEVSKANRDGTVYYSEFIFLATGQKAEISSSGMNPQRVAKPILKNHLIEGGKLNQKAVDEFVLVHGTPFKDRVKY